MTDIIHPLLLCGGSGTRLWPLSRKSYPKQFALQTGGHSLFQASALRLARPAFGAPLLVTGSDYRFVVSEQLAAIDLEAAATIIEPAARNTAPAILAGALILEARHGGQEQLMLVAPSDHVIADAERFRGAVAAAVPVAREGRIVTFGIRPTRPETGYGWLALSQDPGADFAPVAQPLDGFVEKPDLQTAQALVAGGRHLWNAGIFLFTTRTLIAAFENHAPEMLEITREAVAQAEQDLHFTRLAPKPWDRLPDLSIDYAIMEKARNLSVVPYGGDWSDLGSWEAVWREGVRDENGVVTSPGATAINCRETLLRAEDPDQQLVGIGLDNIVAIATPDAVLVAHRDQTQEVKQAVAILKAREVSQAETLPRDYRPWGWFECLGAGQRFQVKRIVVNPGAALSLQSHHHRAEHWIVVEGTARITIDDEVKLVTENQSVYIPLGAVHRMENPGKLPMVLIEVQTGAYLGEDDIVRYEDVYSRGQGAKG
ncbi:mannose-1-phosphate guanylyltransferase/mannose-6-phosphate isomerase [Ponticoccus alexandrii]|uniref:mannose-1-phosphate guanylyltransferase n=1 Tax=Ponticoccus alexandrii TaxID=1943633 RepID=A0ABX7FDF2_9RHOB|nr:mannose-1-phosphate guanylyltransferase/mannose-6-phosphate isomerase [Ponticoccus alexandrii]ETA50639.1 mannose-1-phosphate guanyltransferase [Rhodobacteraceae bacterium PD-2]QRF68613.1 mannose-1-phosphate guanylyltransferase/mannose-6-phosphate isomerase [Ponticoccus alexandrii]